MPGCNVEVVHSRDYWINRTGLCFDQGANKTNAFASTVNHACTIHGGKDDTPSYAQFQFRQRRMKPSDLLLQLGTETSIWILQPTENGEESQITFECLHE